MEATRKEVGLIGLGNMGMQIARRLRGNGYSLVLYDRTAERYAPFKEMENVHLSGSVREFAEKLGSGNGNAIAWMMIPGGQATNQMVGELSELLKKGDIVIDASNSVYTDSMSNFERLGNKGIRYLDVGCAGGPEDLSKGVTLMVGGERDAFKESEDVIRTVSGSGTYGYVGGSGSGHMAKLVHNGIFYGIFPVYAEGVELLMRMANDRPERNFDMGEALRLLASSPPITTDIMNAAARAVSKEELPKEAPQMSISGMVKWEASKAEELGVSLSITRAILDGYATMSEGSRRIYGAAKRIITGH